jgi:hypothetical protein
MDFCCRLYDSGSNIVEYRNLCIDGGYEICGEMYNKNILAPLKAFVPKANPTSCS